MKALKISILLTILLGSMLISNGNTYDNLDKVKDLDAYSTEIFSLTNDYRTKNSLKEFIFSKKLSQTAQIKADDMCKNQYFSHKLPNGDEWYTYLDKSGYEYKTAGENLGKGYDTTDNLFKAWLNSPKHKENIDKSYTHLGIGYSYCDGKNYSVQLFAS